MADDKKHKDMPCVSIIVPVYNDEEHIGLLIESLISQNYPEEKREIIIIDNGSTDQTLEIIKRYPVVLLQEKEIQSSYAARNRGIRSARYDVLAFIDSDCVASANWLQEGIRTLQREKADLVGGKVEFFVSQESTATEMYDSLAHFDFKKSIQKRLGTGAGNLFTYRLVFEKVGFFPLVKSGGDFQWSLNAIRQGNILVYESKAVIMHPARSLGQLVQKRFRTGVGTTEKWLQSKGFFKMLISTFRLLFPRRPSMIRKAIRERGQPWMEKKFWRIWGVAYLCNLVSFWGIVAGSLAVRKGRLETNVHSKDDSDR